MRLRHSFWCAAMVLLASAAAGQDVQVGARVRAADDRARQLLAVGDQTSPTFRSLVSALEESDLIVLISVEPRSPWTQSIERCYHGSTRLLVAAGGQRYVAVWIDSLWQDAGTSSRPVALLAHELQHAVEIARAPNVVDQVSMVSLYERIGRQLWARHYETDGAIAVESRVWGEIVAGSAGPKSR